MLVWQICNVGLRAWRSYSQTNTVSRSKRAISTISHIPPEHWKERYHPNTITVPSVKNTNIPPEHWKDCYHSHGKCSRTYHKNLRTLGRTLPFLMPCVENSVPHTTRTLERTLWPQYHFRTKCEEQYPTNHQNTGKNVTIPHSMFGKQCLTYHHNIGQKATILK